MANKKINDLPVQVNPTGNMQLETDITGSIENKIVLGDNPTDTFDTTSKTIMGAVNELESTKATKAGEGTSQQIAGGTTSGLLRLKPFNDSTDTLTISAGGIHSTMVHEYAPAVAPSADKDIPNIEWVKDYLDTEEAAYVKKAGEGTGQQVAGGVSTGLLILKGNNSDTTSMVISGGGIVSSKLMEYAPAVAPSADEDIPDIEWVKKHENVKNIYGSIWKRSVDQQNNIAKNTWLEVIQQGELALEDVSRVGNALQVDIAGNYNIDSSVWFRETTDGYKYAHRVILKRTVVLGAAELTSPSINVARITNSDLAYHADSGAPLTSSPLYQTNIVTVSGANEAAYNVSGVLITGIDSTTGKTYLEYPIVGTPASPATGTITVVMEVCVGFSGYTGAYSAGIAATDSNPIFISKTVNNLLVNDTIRAQAISEEGVPSKSIDLIWSKQLSYLEITKV